MFEKRSVFEIQGDEGLQYDLSAARTYMLPLPCIKIDISHLKKRLSSTYYFPKKNIHISTKIIYTKAHICILTSKPLMFYKLQCNFTCY